MKNPNAKTRTLPLTFHSVRSVDDIRSPTSPKSVPFTSNEHNRSGRGPTKRSSHPISKVRYNYTNPSPSSVLADNLAGRVVEGHIFLATDND